MKAPTLLETLIQLHAESGKSITDRDIDRITTFYSTPFTPEMLTGEKAIFAGWKYTSDQWWHDLKNGDWMILCAANEESHEFSIDFSPSPNSVYITVSKGIKPRTLAQFISDCNRAGIPLTFTPYGEKLWRGEQ